MNDTLGLWVAIDVGGTFTDLVALDPISGRMVVNKVPSTPQDYSMGVVGFLMGWLTTTVGSPYSSMELLSMSMHCWNARSTFS